SQESGCGSSESVPSVAPSASSAAAAFSQLGLTSVPCDAPSGAEDEWVAEEWEIDEGNGAAAHVEQATQTDVDVREGYRADDVIGTGQVAVRSYVRRMPEYAQKFVGSEEARIATMFDQS
ncbi:hypothetical protein AAVH_36615, partial [Aphelenchoides avenae]